MRAILLGYESHHGFAAAAGEVVIDSMHGLVARMLEAGDDGPGCARRELRGGRLDHAPNVMLAELAAKHQR